MNKIVLCLLAFVVVTVLSRDSYSNDRVLLQDVKILKFNAGETAVNTRTPEVIPRLSCAYNPLGNDNLLPTSVTCKNKGLDDVGSIIWKCEAEMDSALTFDNIQVSCEGYDRPGDKYIRSGSCALTYTLKIAPDAKPRSQQPIRENVPPPPPQGYQHPRTVVRDHHEHYRTPETKAASVWTFSNVLIFVLIVFLIIRCCFKKGKKVDFENNNNNETNETVYEKNPYDNESNNNSEPSAPPYDEVEGSGSVTKRTGYAETVSR